MNVNERAVQKIKQQEILSKDELFDIISEDYGRISRSYFYEIVLSLVKNGDLIKLDSDTYTTKNRKKFSYSLCEENIEPIVKEFGDYCLWDTNILNKWLNHLLNSVVTFVEVDKDMLYLVANDLKEKNYNHILINPSVNEFFKYFDNHTIIIKPSVISLTEKDHRISLERLIIELYSNKIVNSLYGSSEKVTVFNDVFKTYNVDLNKLYHIAKRKKIYDDFHSYLLKNVNKGCIYHD